MIRKTCLTLAAAVVTMASAPRQAQAICGGSSFATCAAVSIVKALLPNGQVQLLIGVANLSGTNGTANTTKFTQIGLWGLPNTASYVAGSLFVLGGSGAAWQLGANGLSGAGIQANVFGVDTRRGINGALDPGSGAIFGFRLTGVSLAQINVRNWAIHGQGGPNGCSTKLVSTNGSVNSGPYSPACSTTPNVTPEPASLLLVATGLASLGVVGLRRRRR